MLQARDFACRILAAIVAALPAVALAQDDPVQAPKREINRIGDQPVEREAELELTAPKPDPATLPKVETPEARAAREAAERQQRVRSSLADARRALAEGRIDQPGDDCAWQHFRRVLDIEPENAEALAGLVRVQDALIGRAGDYARDLDFETADRILDDAALVRDDPERIDRAREDIRVFRDDYAARLELSAVEAMDGGRFGEAERALAASQWLYQRGFWIAAIRPPTVPAGTASPVTSKSISTSRTRCSCARPTA